MCLQPSVRVFSVNTLSAPACQAAVERRFAENSKTHWQKKINGKVQPQDGAGKHTNVYITGSASGISIIASQEFLSFLEVKVGVEEGYLIGGTWSTNGLCLIRTRPRIGMIYCHRKKHKPNVCLATWQVNTYNDILLELLRVSCTFSPNSWGLWFLYSCRSFFFVWQPPPQNGCSCSVEPFQQASLMQSTFPIFCSKFPLFGDWLNIDDFSLPVITSCPASLLSLSFVSACLPLLFPSDFVSSIFLGAEF